MQFEANLLKSGGLSDIVIVWKAVREQEREEDMRLSAHGATDWTDLFAHF